MTGYTFEFMGMSAFVVATLGFSENAMIALLLYFGRKLILYFVGTHIAREAN